MTHALRWQAALTIAAFAAPAPAASAPPQYIYYLHGRIVEDSGPRGISPRYGAYDYPGILAALAGRGATVISEQRPRNTDPAAYADKIAAQVRARIAAGVPAARITVIGASKGSVIAALVSTRLQLADVRYVLIANCNDWLIRTHHPRLSGAILSIYEASDDVGGTCRPLVARSPTVQRFREVRLATGLGHGIVYRPLAAWVKPTLDWATR